VGSVGYETRRLGIALARRNNESSMIVGLFTSARMAVRRVDRAVKQPEECVKR
jgi:hypothetical protein